MGKRKFIFGIIMVLIVIWKLLEIDCCRVWYWFVVGGDGGSNIVVLVI